jgi:hypothetical protein
MADGILKRCTKCRYDKAHCAFSVDLSKRDGLRPSCKLCDLANRPNVLIASRKWKQKNAERVREYKRKVQAALPKNPRPPKDPTAPVRAKRAWKKRNPNKVAADRVRRRAIEVSRIPAWASKESIERHFMLARYLSAAFGVAFHVDHRVPLRANAVCGLCCLPPSIRQKETVTGPTCGMRSSRHDAHRVAAGPQFRRLDDPDSRPVLQPRVLRLPRASAMAAGRRLFRLCLGQRGTDVAGPADAGEVKCFAPAASGLRRKD